jgi:hypothetical protein
MGFFGSGDCPFVSLGVSGLKPSNEAVRAADLKEQSPTLAIILRWTIRDNNAKAAAF